MATQTRQQLDNETQVRNFLDEQVKAIRAKDGAKVASFYAPESVQFLMMPPLQYAGRQGSQAENLQQWFDTFDGDLEFEIKNLDVAAGSDIAYAYCLARLGGKKIGSEKSEIWLRETICMRKLDGEWKIFHFHESVPFYMDGSFKAAVDLRP